MSFQTAVAGVNITVDVQQIVNPSGPAVVAMISGLTVDGHTYSHYVTLGTVDGVPVTLDSTTLTQVMNDAINVVTSHIVASSQAAALLQSFITGVQTI